jgi:superfamily II DNA or RNA helicase
MDTATAIPALWPHQAQGLADVKDLIDRGVRRVLVTAPTGSGKTRLMIELARFVSQFAGVAWYVNRRLMVEQTARVLKGLGLPAGVRAAGYRSDPDHPVQVCSVQTAAARSVRPDHEFLRRPVHEAALVLVDEAHLMKSAECRAILSRHIDGGATVVGFTATPIDLGDLYDELVVCGRPSELRRSGCLVPAYHYGPDEPDLSFLKQRPGEDLSEEEQRRAMGGLVGGKPTRKLARLFGSVLDNWQRLNPYQRPTVLFAPGVPESRWFAGQFRDRGIAAAHIDGESVWIDGEEFASDRESRQAVLDRLKTGEVRVVCNRFVLREGIDAPHLECGILACVVGSLASYIQMGGRLLRSSPGKSRATVIDGGGNWWRHGSLNADRDWSLQDTGRSLARVRPKPEQSPVRCPQCAMILQGRYCPACQKDLSGWRPVRPVVQLDGRLVYQYGDVYPARVEERRPDTEELWKKMYWRCRNAKRPKTFAQAVGLFFHENGYWPPSDLPLMPAGEGDRYRRIVDVPRERLH